MDVQVKIDKYKKRMDKAETGDTVKVIEFKRKHFKKELSTGKGFGYQDLKKSSREFYKWMINEDIEMDMAPRGGSEDFSVTVTTVKCECAVNA